MRVGVGTDARECRDLSRIGLTCTVGVRENLAHDVFVPSPLPLSRWERGSSASGRKLLDTFQRQREALADTNTKTHKRAP